MSRYEESSCSRSSTHAQQHYETAEYGMIRYQNVIDKPAHDSCSKANTAISVTDISNKSNAKTAEMLLSNPRKTTHTETKVKPASIPTHRPHSHVSVRAAEGHATERSANTHPTHPYRLRSMQPKQPPSKPVKLGVLTPAHIRCRRLLAHSLTHSLT